MLACDPLGSACGHEFAGVVDFWYAVAGFPGSVLDTGDEEVELVKQVAAVPWAGAGFWVVLGGEHGEGFVFERFDDAVVGAGFADAEFGLFDACWIHCEAVVLAGDANGWAAFFPDGDVCAAVAELHFVGARAPCASSELVAVADAECGELFLQGANGWDRLPDNFGVAWVSWSVCEEQCVGFDGVNVFFGGVPGELDEVEAADEVSQDVALDAGVNDGNGVCVCVEGSAVGEVALVVAAALDDDDGTGFACEVVCFGAWHGANFFGECFHLGFVVGDEAAEAAFDAGFEGECAGVDAADSGDAFVFEPLVDGAFCVAVVGGEAMFPDDDGAGPNFVAFPVQFIDAVVANHWVGEHEDLAVVGWIREGFLVSSHTGVEHQFAVGGS